MVKALIVQSDGTNDASAILYDALTATSTEVATCAASPESPVGVVQVAGEGGIQCGTGLYLAITGTGAKAIVWYRLRG